MDMDSIRKMLDDFIKLDIGKKQQPEQTFMQLSGYPHYENVCSNILSFFFDTGGTHGYKDLFVRSLLECTHQALSVNACHTETVERECKTDNNKRIDIIFSTEAYVVGIENKIYSNVYNDLNDYEAYVAKLSEENDKIPVCILLSIYDNGGAIENSGFTNITYKRLIEKLKTNLGRYVLSLLKVGDSTEIYYNIVGWDMIDFAVVETDFFFRSALRIELYSDHEEPGYWVSEEELLGKYGIRIISYEMMPPQG